jgi:hypothetical protein
VKKLIRKKDGVEFPFSDVLLSTGKFEIAESIHEIEPKALPQKGELHDQSSESNRVSEDTTPSQKPKRRRM